jgi:two-component system phosphate regulon sensor histidine kinase PhoR
MQLNTWFWRLLIVQALVCAGFALTCLVLVANLRSSANPSAWNLMAGLAVATLVAVAVSALATWLSWRKVQQPIAALALLARQLSSGDEGELPPPQPGDELDEISGALQRISGRLHQGEGEAQQNTERLQAVLASMIEGVLAVGPDKTILLANQAGQRLLDFATAQPVGRPLLEVTRARAVYEAVQQALDSRTDVQKEFDSPGVQRRVLLLRASCLAGEPCPGVMVVVHDVSEIRRLENLRREFVANVSHELKTPLSAIKAYAETLRMGAVNDRENNLHFVHRIEEQAERLHELIQDMLQIARIEAGQETFRITDVSMAELMDDCLAQFAELAATKQIDLVGELPDEEVKARGDEEGLRTILSNLVDNAIKYTRSGGEVQIRCQPHGDTVSLEVQDSGIGIAEKEQVRIFERFYRVDRARSREMGGTGLGLSIVKNLAQAFGGSVGISSELGKGSTFRVTLRRAGS